MEILEEVEVKCYHCGQPCEKELVWSEKIFCCPGCQTVYQILEENNLCEYYTLDKQAGNSLRYMPQESFAFLDEAAIQKKLLLFHSDTFARTQFYIPSIHCVSCLWLLENLKQLHGGIGKTAVNFSKKTVLIDFNPREIALSRLGRLLAQLGYAPQVSLASISEGKEKKSNSVVIQLAVAGFCFGNIMLFSFPEYLGLEGEEKIFGPLFSTLNIVFSLPVLLYSARDYLRAGWRSIVQREINIDVPIAAGLLALFLRSIFDVAFHTGPGYFDSLTGLVFFLLIGRWFQSQTYDNLAFDRDYRSYFPLAVNRLEKTGWKPVVIYEIKKGDRLKIRNLEIIPADSLLLDEEAFIDYSFVTGESRPSRVQRGECIYAGGRLVGQPIEVVAEKPTVQSYLTGLWNEENSMKTGSPYKKLIDRVARRFTWGVLVFACLTAVFWFFHDPSRLWLTLTSVLIVACPCALALAAPFTYGHTMRAFGQRGLYLKNADVVESLATIDAVVFDKTGTITFGKSLTWHGKMIRAQQEAVSQLTQASTHPLSRLIASHLGMQAHHSMSDFSEWPGRGIQGKINNVVYKIGSPQFVGAQNNATSVYVSADEEILGYFAVETRVRPEIKTTLQKLTVKYLAMLSGDNEGERKKMEETFPRHADLQFNFSPHQKLHYISDLQKKNFHVMMIGDGLNDAGAIRQSHVGIALSEEQGLFSPASDAILSGNKLSELNDFFLLAKNANRIVKISFIISLFYNVLTLCTAAFGFLTPLIAAILMPVSSLSVVGFSTVAVNWCARRIFSSKK